MNTDTRKSESSKSYESRAQSLDSSKAFNKPIVSDRCQPQKRYHDVTNFKKASVDRASLTFLLAGIGERGGAVSCFRESTSGKLP